MTTTYQVALALQVEAASAEEAEQIADRAAEAGEEGVVGIADGDVSLTRQGAAVTEPEPPPPLEPGSFDAASSC